MVIKEGEMKMKYVVGIDIGGTTVKIGLFTTEAQLLDKWEVATRKEDNGAYILNDVAESVKEKLEEKGIALSDVTGAGVGVPGPVTADGVVKSCVNLGWGTFSVADTMTELLGIPVKAGNDANVAALGEMWNGGAKGYKNVILVTLGTGVGGGIIIDGKVVAGSHGAGGEIGHATVNPHETVACNCGKKGCLEQYSSATGLIRGAKEALKKSDMPSVLRDMTDFMAKEILDAAKAGDEFAVLEVEKFCRILGRALSVFAVVADPEVIVIGGGVSKAGTYLTDMIQKYFDEYAFHACTAKVVLAELGNDAGIYGAAKLCM